MRITLCVLMFLIVFAVPAGFAEDKVSAKFSTDYATLDQDLLNNIGEEATISNFVYQKDVATFTFREGTIHLLRYVDGRPTTAVFMGKGNALIRVPSHVEQQSLMSVTKDSVVNEDFEICFIRMADDFDLKLKEKFTFEQKELKWKNFTQVRQVNGEVFFKPVIQHKFDNYFQLLTSVYERNADGFFWADFNRYGFCYDPNRPEEAIIYYEFRPNDFVATEAAVFQKQSRGVTDDTRMSDIMYPVTAVAKEATFTMGGVDGSKIDMGQATVKITINSDSLKYVPTFLHYNLKIDSIYCNDLPVEYYRRKDFTFIGVILPEYKYKGDTVTFTYWYSGFNFDYPLPYVQDPTPSPLSLAFIVPNGFNYIVPGMGPVEPNGNNHDKFQANPPFDVSTFHFQGYASGYDTVEALSDIGLTVNFLRPKFQSLNDPCFVQDKLYQETMMAAINYMTGKVGNPPGTFQLFVYPDNFFSAPGLMELPQVLCYSEGPLTAMGGLNLFVGFSSAQQWFGHSLRPETEREIWLKDAAAEYLSLLFIENSVKGGAYYSNLLNRRDSLYTERSLNQDRPLATGERAGMTIRNNKGPWLLHMLRSMMYDFETGSEKTFNRFLYELAINCNSTMFTNADVIKLAEKHYGQPLDWFFKHWLYGYGYPEYNVEYTIGAKEGRFFIDVTAQTKGVPSDFRMPVMIRIVGKDGQSSFRREVIPAGQHSFQIGPFDAEPKEIVFNEFFSVLSEDKVKKK